MARSTCNNIEVMGKQIWLKWSKPSLPDTNITKDEDDIKVARYLKVKKMNLQTWKISILSRIYSERSFLNMVTSQVS